MDKIHNLNIENKKRNNIHQLHQQRIEGKSQEATLRAQRSEVRVTLICSQQSVLLLRDHFLTLSISTQICPDKKGNIRHILVHHIHKAMHTNIPIMESKLILR